MVHARQGRGGEGEPGLTTGEAPSVVAGEGHREGGGEIVASSLNADSERRLGRGAATCKGEDSSHYKDNSHNHDMN